MTSVPHSGAKSVTPGGSVAGGHTKGPWFLEGGGDFREVSAPDHRALARVVWQMEDDRICGESSPTQEANARLIAAAPDLLEALQYAVNTIEAMRPTFSQVKDEGHAYHDQVLTTARAAIAKATAGETRNAEGAL